MKNRATILITNDDGYGSEGIEALIEALTPLGEVFVVAPAHEKSACSHSLTLTKPLIFKEQKQNHYALDDGTPTDAVYLSLSKLFSETKPDLVVSGINHGSNMGEDITYSGTAAGAMEAALHSINSFAISQVYAEGGATLKSIGFALAKEYAAKIATMILQQEITIAPREFLNVNIPPIPKAKGVKITHAGRRNYAHHATSYTTPRGEEFWWVGLPELSWNRNSKESDFEAIDAGYVSITPITTDLTSYQSLEGLKRGFECL